MGYTKGKPVNLFYKTTAWKKKRLEILERDNYECVMCKAEGKVTTSKDATLEIDHIVELETDESLALVDSNLRTLCRKCHNKRHDRFGFNKQQKKWNDERFD